MSADRHHAEHIVGECIQKCVQAILAARSYPAQHARGGKPNRWFQLELEEVPEVRTFLEPCRSDPYTPVELEVHCSPAGRHDIVVLERWRLVLEPGAWPVGNGGPGGGVPQTGSYHGVGERRTGGGSSSGSGGSAGGRLAGDDGALYKRLTLLVRMLVCQLRMLPVHQLVRAFRRQPIPVWRMGYRLARQGSCIGPGVATPQQPAPGQELCSSWAATPVPFSASLGGFLRLRVDHVAPAAIAALQDEAASCPVPASAPRVIIHDYLGASGGNTGSGPVSGRVHSGGVPGSPASAAAAVPSAPLSGSSAWMAPRPLSSRGMPIPLPTGTARTSSSASLGGTSQVMPGRNAEGRREVPALVSAASVPVTGFATGAAGSPLVRQSWGRRPNTQLPGSPAGGGPTGRPPPSPRTPAPVAMATTCPPGTTSARFSSPGQPPAWGAAHTPPLPSARPFWTEAPTAGGNGVPGNPAGTSPTAARMPGTPLLAEPSKPVAIPGPSTQHRVRSLADMQVVYNFPDNLAAVSSRACGAAGRGSGSVPSAVGIPVTAPGSAPAATQRGMLGQALEAHLAHVRAQAVGGATAAGAATGVAPTSRSTIPPPVGHAGGTGGQPTGPPTGLLEAEGTARLGGRGPESAQPHPVPCPGEGSVWGQASEQGSLSRRMQRVSSSGQLEPQQPEGRSWRGVPDSPSLPFAFTPSAHSLSTSLSAQSHMQAARLLLGGHAASAASPSSGPFTARGALPSPGGGLPLAPGPSTAAGGVAGSSAGSAGGAASAGMITGRDVSSLALARRPSWLEHSARVGRSTSTSGGTLLLPGGEENSLGASSGLRSHTAGTAQGTPRGSARGGVPPGGRGTAPATPSAARASPSAWALMMGSASWLQAPRVTTGAGVVGGSSTGPALSPPSGLWAHAVLPDLPPPVSVEVGVPAGVPAVGVDEQAHKQGAAPGTAGEEGQLDDDLPFLLDLEPAETETAVGHRAAGSADAVQGAALPGTGVQHAAWPYALACPRTAQQPHAAERDGSGEGDVGSSPAPGVGLGALPGLHPNTWTGGAGVGGDLILPERDVAVGLLLSYLTASKQLPIDSSLASAPADDQGTELTFGAALEQLSDLQGRLSALLSAPA